MVIDLIGSGALPVFKDLCTHEFTHLLLLRIHLRNIHDKNTEIYKNFIYATCFDAGRICLFCFSEPKPVKCGVCGRGFKNIPALNGHMRLHGGYVRKVCS